MSGKCCKVSVRSAERCAVGRHKNETDSMSYRDEKSSGLVVVSDILGKSDFVNRFNRMDVTKNRS